MKDFPKEIFVTSCESSEREWFEADPSPAEVLGDDDGLLAGVYKLDRVVRLNKTVEIEENPKERKSRGRAKG